ncbi:MAG: hypothetical protein HW403_1014 [Dehalococcoidia bacterium]|nr:hypothetical protein [Dehalococcoidia bacterium]
MRCGCGCIFGLISLVALGLSALAMFLALQAPSPLPPSPQTSPQAASQFDRKLATVLTSAPGTQVPLTMEEVNSKLATTMSAGAGPVPIKRLQVSAPADGKLEGIGVISMVGKDLWVTAKLGVAGGAGKLTLKVEGVKLGRLPIPTSLAGKLLGPVMQRAQDATGAKVGLTKSIDLPKGIEGIQVKGGQLILVAGAK